MATFTRTMLDLMFICCGLISIYGGVKTLLQKDHPTRYGTGVFWILLGIVVGFGHYIQAASDEFGNIIVGVLVVAMALPAMFKKVRPGFNKPHSKEYAEKMSDKIGNKIFFPTLSIGVVSLIFALAFGGPDMMGANAPIVGLFVGCIISGIWILSMSKDKPVELLDGGKRLLEAVGSLCILPQMLATLGAVFTAANIGTLVAQGAGAIIPEGNVFIGIIVYCVGMALFTMIMGNAFAAFAVMTIGIGIPFVISHGLNPTVIGMLALTAGYSGTLMTPMAANFNILPVAILEMKDKYGVIKRQAPIALTLLLIHIVLMNLLG